MIGGRTRDTRTATYPTTSSSSGFGRYVFLCTPEHCPSHEDVDESLSYLFVCLCVATDGVADGRGKENPALAVCDRNIQSPHEWLC